MTKKMNTTDIETYLGNVGWRVDHHGPLINEVIYPLIGAVLRFKDPDRPMTVKMTKKGQPGNVIWVYLGGKRYVFMGKVLGSRQHQVVIRARSIRGEIVAKFTNATSVGEIVRVVRLLTEKAKAA